MSTATLLENLLLFDTFVLDSVRLTELPALVCTLGFGGMRLLLESGGLSICCDLFTTAQAGQTDVPYRRERGGLLPLGSYSLTFVRAPNIKEYHAKCLSVIETIPELDRRQKSRLNGLVNSHLVAYPVKDMSDDILRQFEFNFAHNAPGLLEAIPIAAHRLYQTRLDPLKIRLNIEKLGERDVRIQSNIPELTGLDQLAAHKIVEAGFLALSSRDFRITLMKHLNVLTSFRSDDAPIVDPGFDFALRQVTPNVRIERFRRLAELKGLPSFTEAVTERRIDVERLLEVRESKECREFRDWLWSTDQVEDEAARDRVESFREHVAQVAQSKPGRVIRWFLGAPVSIALASNPVASLFAGVALGPLDSFLFERVFHSSGARAFIDHSLPSIFDREPIRNT